MKTLTSVLTLMVLTTPLVAQDTIPQDLPSQFRQDAVRRTVEQPITIPRLPLQQPTNNYGLPTSLRVTNKQTTQGRANAVSVEDRIAALEAKVAALQSEIEAQKAIIKQLQERLDQQEKKN
jgi:hypothetical protein